MKIKLARWYIAIAVRIPGYSQPACIGLGLDGYEEQARESAVALASATGAWRS